MVKKNKKERNDYMNKLCIVGAIAAAVAGLVAIIKTDDCELSERKTKAEEKVIRKKISDSNKELVANIERAEEIAQDYKDFFLVPQMGDEMDKVIEYRQKIKEMDLAVKRMDNELKLEEDLYDSKTGYTYTAIKAYKKMYRSVKELIDYINDDIIYGELGYDLPDEDDGDVEPYSINVPKVNYVEVEQEEEDSGKKKKKKKSSKKKDKKKSKKKKSKKNQDYDDIYDDDYEEEDDDFDPYSASVDELEEYLEFDIREKIPDMIENKPVKLSGYVDRKRDEPDAYQMNELEEFNGAMDDFFEELAQNEEVFKVFAPKLGTLIETIRKLITLKILYIPMDDRVDKLIKKYMSKLTTIRANARYDRKVVY